MADDPLDELKNFLEGSEEAALRASRNIDDAADRAVEAMEREDWDAFTIALSEAASAMSDYWASENDARTPPDLDW